MPVIIKSLIKRNSARCAGCGDEVVSTSRHDFVCCSCGGLCVDGGLDYLRRAFNPALPPFEETSITEDVEEEVPDA